MTVSAVRLAGITFQVTDVVDGDGDLFVVSDLKGWDGGDVEIDVVEYPVEDGGVIASTRLTSWVLALSGWVVAGPDGLGPARRKLREALYGIVATDGTLEVDEEDGTYTVIVRLATGLRTRDEDAGSITFEASLLAVVPVKVLAAS
jgi:hypothetical protein